MLLNICTAYSSRPWNHKSAVRVQYGGTGRTLANSYDALNRLEQIDEQPGGGGTTRTTTYLRDLSGNMVRKELPNATAEERSHDALNRVHTIDTILPGSPPSTMLSVGIHASKTGNPCQQN